MRSFCLILIACLFSFGLDGQTNFHGKIINSENNRSLSNVTIKFGKKGATSDMKGEFIITNPEFPLILEISHLGFYSKTAIYQSILESGVIIKLEPKTTEIEVVEVVGEKIKRYFKDKYHYIIDYQIIDKQVLTISYENGKLLNGFLTLSSYSKG